MAGPTTAQMSREIGRMDEEIKALEEIWISARRDERAAYRAYLDARRERASLVEEMAGVDPATVAGMAKGYGA